MRQFRCHMNERVCRSINRFVTQRHSCIPVQKLQHRRNSRGVFGQFLPGIEPEQDDFQRVVLVKSLADRSVLLNIDLSG